MQAASPELHGLRVAVTNFEYDTYQMDWEFEIIGTDVAHTLLANGNVKSLGKNKYQVSFPDHFTTSSPYIMIFKNGERIIRQIFTLSFYEI